MSLPPPRRTIRAGFERLPPDQDLPRHQHADAYATIVLDGAYEQIAFAGRLQLEAGDVLIQPTLDCHADRMLSRGLTLIRLPWRREPNLGGLYRGCRIDSIRRAAERDVAEATALLEEDLGLRTRAPVAIEHWADRLAADLSSNPNLRITAWADAMRLSRERVSRGFASVYGIAPTQFRSELRARAAWFEITGGFDSLSKIALDHGFSDQAHMTRAVKALTQATPMQWRRSHLFKTTGTATGKLQ